MNLEEKNVLVLGAGGISGKGMVSLLRNFTKKIYVFDDNKSICFDEDLENVSNYPITTKKEILDLINKFPFEYCFLSPGFPRKSLIVKTLEEVGIPVIGELDLGYYVIFNKIQKKPFIVAITGTDGKSTTTKLIAELLRSQDKIAIECGNYGTPLCEIANQMMKNIFFEILVVECSSFQLEKLYFFQSDIAIFLNLAEDHMDRYESLQEYLLAKLNLIGLGNPNQHLIISSQVVELIKKFRFENRIENKKFHIIDTSQIHKDHYFFMNSRFLWKDFKIDNLNNRINLLFALKALEIFFNHQVVVEKIQETLRNFSGLPYRQQVIKKINNLIFVNDSKATTVQAVLSAIKNYENQIVMLLIGGQDKNLNFKEILSLQIYKEKRLLIFPFGSARDKIQNQLKTKKTYPNLEIAFNDALKKAKFFKNKEVVILLSPGCASFDQYKNYKERGEHFNLLVERVSHEQFFKNPIF
ncbi:MAG: UDP-N-acetylmuramoyl-L-alanine--D-glutamate ligase [Leptonema sp. (in: bacteria)]